MFGPAALGLVEQSAQQARQRGLSDRLPPDLEVRLERIQRSLAGMQLVPSEADAEQTAGAAQELLAVIQELERIFDPNPLSSMLR